MTTTKSLVPPETRFGAATLPEVLERASAATEGGFVFVDSSRGETWLSLPELARRATAAASVLAGHGVRPGDRVCLLSSTSPEMMVALWGVWRAGAVPAVLSVQRRKADADRHRQELCRRVGQADARMLLVADQLAATLDADAVGATVMTLDRLEQPGVRTRLPEPPVEPSDLALLQFTSGTTAQSRAVALTHRQILSNVSGFSGALGLSPTEDKAVSWLPLYHDMGILNVIATVAHGGLAVLQPPEDFVFRPGSWLDLISRHRGTVTVAPNMAYALAARQLRLRPRDLDLSCLRVAGNGAEPVDAAVLTDFVEQAGRHGFKASAMCPMYGLAEMTLGVTVSPPDEAPREIWVSRTSLETERIARSAPADQPGARRFVACGPPLPGVEVGIRDDDGNSLEAGRVGEIWTRSPSMMSGYWHDEEATRAVLRDGWLRTGDLGFLHDGELVVCGRLKDMIVVGGRNLYPEDYEQLATAQKGVRHGNVIAFGLLDAERMVVVAETALSGEKAQRLATDLMRLLTQELSHAPEEVLLTAPGTLPKTSSGKLQRGVCRDRYRSARLAVVASACRT